MTDLSQKPPPPLNDHTQQIVYAISHDLQGPTRLIKSFLQLLEADLGSDLNEQARGYLERVTTAADSLQERLAAITLLSRVSSLGQSFAPCRLGDAFDDAIGVLESTIERTAAVIRLSDPSPIVIADRSQLRDVFVQIIGNALKFCDHPATVLVQATMTRDECVVVISDSGPGFDSRDSDSAFELFRRFHPASVPGTGAGLAIVRRILERHQTDAHILSSADTHTTVTFVWRLATPGPDGTQ